MEQWKKLNYLASSLAPDYSADGYMRGNLVELTIGGWLYKQVGFIGGFALTLPEESPWEIAIPDSAGGPGLASDPTVKEMPMICNVEGFELRLFIILYQVYKRIIMEQMKLVMLLLMVLKDILVYLMDQEEWIIIMIEQNR